MKTARVYRQPCRHCRQVRSLQRQLCWKCRHIPAISCCYPSTAPRGSRPDFYGRGTLPEPTAALPGSPEKIDVLTARAAAGQQLWHPLDAPLDRRKLTEQAEAAGNVA